MSGLRKLIGAGIVLAVTVIGSAAPAATQTSATGAPKAYVVTGAFAGCDLQQVDLTTGALTDLAWGTDPVGCVFDLAVTSDGTVHGMGFDYSGGGADARLVTFDSAGTPSWKVVTVPGATDVGMADGGIAVSPDGTLYVNLVAPEVCDTTCLYALDPTTARASLVGPSSLGSLYTQALTWCTSGLRTLIRPDDASAQMQWAVEDVSTGLVTPGVDASEPLGGYDCQPTSATMHAVSNRNGGAGPRPYVPSGPPERVGTVDVSSGDLLPGAELSDPDANVLAFAVVPEARPAPAPTTSTTAGAAAATTVTPMFTG